MAVLIEAWEMEEWKEGLFVRLESYLYMYRLEFR